jgi:hypothetical protein
MANCLRPVGVPGSAYLKSDNYSYHSMPDARNECMPAIPGAFIQTDHGPRRLLHDEFCNGLGVPKPWIRRYPDGKTVQLTIALHLLKFITPLLLQPAVPRPIPVPEMPLKRSKVVTNVRDVGDLVVFSWKPPDLSPGLSWTRETIQELREACDTYDDSEAMFQDGLEKMKRHHSNYDEDGPNPTHLQLLWWEFPKERWWDELREGCLMNFLQEPVHLI